MNTQFELEKFTRWKFIYLNHFFSVSSPRSTWDQPFYRIIMVKVKVKKEKK